MDGKKIILLVGALIVAAVTAFMARSMIMGASAPVADANVAGSNVPVDGPQVLVATKALPVGTILTADSLRFQPWPKELVEGAYYLKEGTDMASLVGTVVRFAVPAGQPLTQGSLVKPGDRGFLAAALAPGMRAVTVPVSAQSSVAGFVFPGDRIDLILTQEIAGGGDGPPLKASETILRNLRVLATDQRTDKKTDEQGKTEVVTFSTVTIETTPTIAEQIAVAQTVGSLSLSLRSIADNAGELEEAIASGNVEVSDDPNAERAMLAGASSRPVVGATSVSTGADVSRYQRRTVPGKPAEANMGPMMAAAQAPGGNYPGGAAPVVQGPVVRVARGNTVTDVAVGGKN